jgi:hypothetical protein
VTKERTATDITGPSLPKGSSVPGLFLLLTALLLSACGQVQTPVAPQENPAPASTLAQSKNLSKFYRANPAAHGYSRRNKVTHPLYVSVLWKDAESTKASYLAKGYLFLGRCDFSDGSIPLRKNAVEYARQLGADVVIYATQPSASGQTDHYIAFLAQSR